MADKVQKIKEEIVRRRKSLPKETEHKGLMAVYGGIAYELTELLQFIDSLPEEHNEDLEEEVSNWRHNHFHGRRDKDASGEYLERESQLDLARHFAEWQKQKSMQDFMEKAEEAISQISRHFIGEDYTFEQVWEFFKWYVANNKVTHWMNVPSLKGGEE